MRRTSLSGARGFWCSRTAGSSWQKSMVEGTAQEGMERVKFSSPNTYPEGTLPVTHRLRPTLATCGHHSANPSEDPFTGWVKALRTQT